MRTETGVGEHHPADQSLRQRTEIFCFKALQAGSVDEELNGLLPRSPCRFPSPSGRRS